MTPPPTTRVAPAFLALWISFVAAGGDLRAAGQATPPPQIDPYAQMEAERLNRESYTRYREICARMRTSGQLESAIQCYGESVRFALRTGLDSMAAQDELIKKEIEGELKAQRDKEDQERKKAQEVTTLTKQAEDALAKDQALDARKYIAEALKLDPANKAAQGISRLVAEELRRRTVARIVTWSVLGTMLLAALGGAFVWFRRARHVSTLEMIEGPQPGDIFRLEKETTVIGALEKEADWPIADLSRRVSRRHCEITRSGNRYFLVDVSTNGTWINGRPAPAGEPILLRRGDLISIADDVVLRFR
jgi:hypothetical protein